MNRAIIDLGTNTFHLKIIDKDFKLLQSETKVAQLGKGGIQKNILTEEAMERAIKVLLEFNEIIIANNIIPENVFAMGTSALRNAENRMDFLEKVQQKTGINIEIIDGDKEAELIYLGVKNAIEIKETSLIIDIGGGSVEFIISNEYKVLWKQSFEIGGLRLLEMFMTSDPIPASQLEKMDYYFLNKLVPLMNAVHQYHPKNLIGSSGTFDTLKSIYLNFANLPELPEEVGIDYPLDEFKRVYDILIDKNRNERMQIKGMVEMRVDMIVVAVNLVAFLIKNIGIERMQISKYSLKEGVISSLKMQYAS